MAYETRVMYVKEDGRDLATWDITGRPERGDQVHRSYKPGDVWEVIAVQWTGSHQARCVCRRVPPNGDEV